MTHRLYSHQEWLDYYNGKAAELPNSTRSDPAALKSSMLAISQSALDSRARQLRDSDSYSNKKLKTAFAGLIPFLKIPVSIDVSEKFADEALRAFGLSDAAGLVAIARQLKKETSGRNDLAIDLLATLGKLSVKELTAHVGANAASETLHLKPFFGQFLSAATGYATTRKRLISIIEKARASAWEVHRDILIPAAIDRLRIPAAVASNRPSRLKSLVFHLFVSIIAKLNLEFMYSCVTMGNISPSQPWVLLATIAIIISLLKQMRAFRVMFASHILGSILFWAYRNIRLDDMPDNDDLTRLLVACFGTVCGLVLLTR